MIILIDYNIIYQKNFNIIIILKLFFILKALRNGKETGIININMFVKVNGYNRRISAQNDLFNKEQIKKKKKKGLLSCFEVNLDFTFLSSTDKNSSQNIININVENKLWCLSVTTVCKNKIKTRNTFF